MLHDWYLTQSIVDNKVKSKLDSKWVGTKRYHRLEFKSAVRRYLDTPRPGNNVTTETP